MKMIWPRWMASPMTDKPATTDMFGVPPESPTFGTDPHKLHRTDAPSTSVAAAHGVNTTEKERMVYEIVESFGAAGCILDDVCDAWFEKHGFSASAVNTISARFKALEEKKLIHYTGEKRPGQSGRQSRVRIAMKFKAIA